ncbi:MAG TPA: Ldh family oxidoreductase [Dehalococcoidia bacterium]|nr:Ldh family oxidoreductase [Dehalococcoidia bacterium]
MPTVQADPLMALVRGIYEAAGTPSEDAEVVTRHQVGANLAGHDSHGVVLLPTYIDRIKRGHIVPKARYEIVEETSTTARIEGNWGFGQVVTEAAMRLCIDKAKANRIAAVTVIHQSHVGRLGDYPLMASREGLVGFICCDSGQSPKAVAPFGGREARLGTNPLSMSFPSDLEAPILIDMATSAVAAGKLNVARARGKSIPFGWLLDAEGRPTDDPTAQQKGGVMLPLGGPEGHKGYALSFLVETLSAVLPGLGFGIDPQGRHNDGAFLFAFDVNAFSPLEKFKKDVGDFARYLKETPPAEGFSEVLYPGEIEYRTEQRLRREGIPIEDSTWQRIGGIARGYGIENLIPS